MIGNSDILTVKLEKYIKRYMGKSIRIGFNNFSSNNFEHLKKYFSFISPSILIINFIDSISDEVKSNLYEIYKLLDLKLIIICREDDSLFKYDNDLKLVKIIRTSANIVGFNEELNKVEELLSYKSQNYILADKFASKIVKEALENRTPEKDENFMSFIEEKEIAKKQMNCSLRLLYKCLPSEDIFNKNVGRFRVELGERTANEIPEEIKSKLDYIVPVPSSGVFYAVGLSKILSVPFLPALKKIEVSERAFEIENVDMRKSFLFKNMELNESLIKGKNILLVDEAIFTGATLKVVCDIFRDSGVNEIHIAIPSPECNNNCEYFVQPKRVMLLNKINKSSLAQYFDVNSVTFLKLEEYSSIMKSLNNEICIECFDNK